MGVEVGVSHNELTMEQEAMEELLSLLYCGLCFMVLTAPIVGAVWWSFTNRGKQGRANQGPAERAVSSSAGQSPPSTAQAGAKGAKPFDRYIAAYNMAESLRKEGKGTEAISYYERAITAVEKDSNTKQFGPPPAPYREFGKMLYHMGQNERALEVLDRYSELQARSGNKADGGWKGFRERIATGDFRRLKNKYQ